MKDTVLDFLSYIGSEKGLAKNTIEAYGRDLDLFCQRLAGKRGARFPLGGAARGVRFSWLSKGEGTGEQLDVPRARRRQSLLPFLKARAARR